LSLLPTKYYYESKISYYNSFAIVYQGATTFELTPPDGLGPNYQAMCTNWHQGELKNRDYYRQQLASMPQCPCTSFFLSFDGRFGWRTIDWANRVLTAPVRHTCGGPFAPHGKVFLKSSVQRHPS
jgi:hypothetical protein